MLRLSGVRLLARELETHKGWDPRFGVWEPQLERLSEERAAPPPSLLDEVRLGGALPLPPGRILWRGPETVGDSLGNVNAESRAALERLGLGERVRFAPISQKEVPEGEAAFDWEIQVPGVAEATVARCLRYLFHEFGDFYRFPVRAGDVFWAPSRWIEARLRRAFPRHRTILAPHGVNGQVFHPGVAPHPDLPGEGFRFLYVGTTISRKGIDLVLRAFREEKKGLPGAELVLKVFPTTAGFVWPEVYRQGEGVRVLDRPLPPAAIASLMRSCDVLVAPSRAEAFCLPVLEGMGCGLASLLPVGSAMQEFCPQGAHLPIEAEIVEVPVEGKTVSFLEPDLGSLRRAMRRAFENREELKALGRRGAEAARHFSWETVTRMVLARGWEAFGPAS